MFSWQIEFCSFYYPFFREEFIEISKQLKKNNKQMEIKNCTKSYSEKFISIFHEKYTECKLCNSKRQVKRSYDNKDKILKQGKDMFMHFRGLVRTYIEIHNRVKAMEEKADNEILLAKGLRKLS